MTTEFVGVPATWTVDQVRRHMREVGRAKETVYAIYVLHPRDQRLRNVVSLREIMLRRPPAGGWTPWRYGRRPITVGPLVDREDVARLISKYNLLAIPVLDDAGRVLGIVTVDDVIDALISEQSEDVQKFGGMAAVDEPYMQIGLGADGPQAGRLALRALPGRDAHRRGDGPLRARDRPGGGAGPLHPAHHQLGRELGLAGHVADHPGHGAAGGAPARLVAGRRPGAPGRPRPRRHPGSHRLPSHRAVAAAGLVRLRRRIICSSPLTVSLALVGVVLFGSLAGSMLPFVLRRVGFDPASASAPFVATLVDVTGLVIYFSVALLLLQGTLL